MYFDIFRRSDCRMVAENKHFSSRAAAEKFCRYIAPKIWGSGYYYFEEHICY